MTNKNINIKTYDTHLLENKQPACQECAMWPKFGEECWYFWKHKKECSQKLKDIQPTENPLDTDNSTDQN